MRVEMKLNQQQKKATEQEIGKNYKRWEVLADLLNNL